MRKLIVALLLFFFVFICLVRIIFYIPSRATQVYDTPAETLSLPQRLQYSTLLLWYDQLLTRPRDRSGSEQTFTVDQGESVSSVASHLDKVGLIRNAEAFRAYLIYAGLDTSIQAGN